MLRCGLNGMYLMRQVEWRTIKTAPGNSLRVVAGDKALQARIYTGSLWGDLRVQYRGNGLEIVSTELQSYFENWLKPSPEEITLFELEFGFNFPPQDLLDQLPKERLR